MNSHTILAPAKLNLNLHIVGKREDGFHFIESLVVFTELGDQLEIYPADRLSLSIHGEFSELLQDDIDNNLVMQAAKMLQFHTDGKGARMILHKHIPVGAGLGGGSSDAAAAIKGLIKLWQPALEKDDLEDIACSLGSDVLVCLSGVSANISGIGHMIKACAFRLQLWVVLLNPKVPLLTPSVYRAFKGTFAPSGLTATGISKIAELKSFLEKSSNMLEVPAIGLLPLIESMLNDISDTAGCLVARMSGSGATCFGLYTEEKTARLAALALEKLYPEAWVAVTRVRNHG